MVKSIIFYFYWIRYTHFFKLEQLENAPSPIFIGKITKSILEKITGSKKILLESNHDVEMLKCGTYPYPLKRRILGEYGHLSNETASKVALHLVQNGTEHIMLGHLSKENNRPEIAMLETYNLLSQSGVDVGKDMTLQVADRYKPTLF